jgi:hypothetical protein
MKIFLEADLAKGNGAVRWEGVTNRRIRGFIVSVLTIVGAFTLAITHRF